MSCVSIIYKAGKVRGFAYNCLEGATNVNNFMAESIFSKYKEVVTLFPVKHIKEEN